MIMRSYSPSSMEIAALPLVNWNIVHYIDMTLRYATCVTNLTQVA